MATTSARGTMNIRNAEITYEKSKADKRKDRKHGEDTKRDRKADKAASKGC